MDSESTVTNSNTFKPVKHNKIVWDISLNVELLEKVSILIKLLFLIFGYSKLHLDTLKQLNVNTYNLQFTTWQLDFTIYVVKAESLVVTGTYVIT